MVGGVVVGAVVGGAVVVGAVVGGTSVVQGVEEEGG